MVNESAHVADTIIVLRHFELQGARHNIPTTAVMKSMRSTGPKAALVVA